LTQRKPASLAALACAAAPARSAAAIEPPPLEIPQGHVDRGDRGQDGHRTPLGQRLLWRRAGGDAGQHVAARPKRLEHVVDVDSVVVRQRRRLAEPDPAGRVLQAYQHELAVGEGSRCRNKRRAQARL
jgi:hypothetical protein